MTLTQDQATGMLRELGWRITDNASFHAALTNFQRGWAVGPALVADGICGPKSSAALQASIARKRAGQGSASTHFSFSEFTCGCGGRFAGCEGIRVLRDLILSLEQMRTKWYPRGLSIVSGYRCPRHNAEVGGASQSQHLYGSAADVRYAVPASVLARARLFSGIGKSASSGLVRHVDRRDVSGVNPTRGTLSVPTVWNYVA